MKFDTDSIFAIFVIFGMIMIFGGPAAMLIYLIVYGQGCPEPYLMRCLGIIGLGCLTLFIGLIGTCNVADKNN